MPSTGKQRPVRMFPPECKQDQEPVRTRHNVGSHFLGSGVDRETGAAFFFARRTVGGGPPGCRGAEGGTAFPVENSGEAANVGPRWPSFKSTRCCTSAV